mmetsp:Transcript_7208/g.8663  ORF Transcript_7208/g.8663 Transcript_7208/m.8663 type:complete len:96 (+) Transcript_7208:722-1009(+)
MVPWGLRGRFGIPPLEVEAGEDDSSFPLWLPSARRVGFRSGIRFETGEFTGDTIGKDLEFSCKKRSGELRECSSGESIETVRIRFHPFGPDIWSR